MRWLALILCLLLAPVAHADDSIRFVVTRPSTVTIESTASGGWRITVEPVEGDPGLPAPPKPNPDMPDPIAEALSRLPEGERVPMAWLFDRQAETAEGMIGTFESPAELGNWLVANIKKLRISKAFTAEHSAAIKAIGDAVATMDGETLAEKLANYRETLGSVIE